jgi:CPA2 family monovalent cation:H+ antiporter-2
MTLGLDYVLWGMQPRGYHLTSVLLHALAAALFAFVAAKLFEGATRADGRPAAVFGLSLALGAFVAGVLISESELSHQAAAEVTAFRDLFAVIFFVSVGMLVDPAGLLPDIGLVILLVIIAVVGKGLLTAGLGRTLGLPARSAIMLGALMGQVGEFSFILADNALDVGLMGGRTYNLILGTAVVSILISPFTARVGEVLVGRLERSGAPADAATGGALGGAPSRTAELSRTAQALDQDDEARRPTVVVLGAGHVGQVVARAVRLRGFRCVVVDRDVRKLEALERLGTVNVFGDAANPEILGRLDLDRARIMIVAIGDPLTARLATERALRINPRLSIGSRVRGKRQVSPVDFDGATRNHHDSPRAG